MDDKDKINLMNFGKENFNFEKLGVYIGVSNEARLSAVKCLNYDCLNKAKRVTGISIGSLGEGRNFKNLNISKVNLNNISLLGAGMSFKCKLDTIMQNNDEYLSLDPKNELVRKVNNV